MRISDWSSDVCSSDLEACRTTAQFGQDPSAQPLPVDRAPPWRVPQVQAQPHHDARAGFGRSDSWHGQVELVGGSRAMAMSDPLGDLLTRIRNGQRSGTSKVRAPASKLRANVLDVRSEERRVGTGWLRSGYHRWSPV